MRWLTLLALGACGGSPAAPFIGVWRGNQTTTITADVAGSMPRTVGGMPVEVVFAEDLVTGDVDFGDCQSGTPNGNTLTVKMSKTPCVVANGSCQLHLTTTTGTVVARGGSMTMDYGGRYLHECPLTADEVGTFEVHANLALVR